MNLVTSNLLYSLITYSYARSNSRYNIHLGNLESVFYGDSITSKWIPIHALSDGTSIKNSANKVISLSYSLVSPKINSDCTMSIMKRFFEHFFQAENHLYQLIRRGSPEGYFIGNGQLLHIDSQGKVIILVTCAFDSKYLSTFDRDNLSSLDIVVVVSRELLFDNTHESIYRGFKKYCFDLITKECGALVVDDIVNLCYKTVVKFQPVKTLEEKKVRDLELSQSISEAKYLYE